MHRHVGKSRPGATQPTTSGMSTMHAHRPQARFWTLNMADGGFLEEVLAVNKTMTKHSPAWTFVDCPLLPVLTRKSWIHSIHQL